MESKPPQRSCHIFSPMLHETRRLSAETRDNARAGLTPGDLENQLRARRLDEFCALADRMTKAPGPR